LIGPFFVIFRNLSTLTLASIPLIKASKMSLTITKLEESRTHTFDGEDKSLLLHVGNFTVWFGAVELGITHLSPRPS